MDFAALRALRKLFQFTCRKSPTAADCTVGIHS